MPGLMKLLLRPAMKVVTNSYADASYETYAGSPTVLIYSHGMISFASENTMLMEHLASHGYVVISIQHLDQLSELRTLQQSQSQDEKREQGQLQREIKSSSGQRRATLWKEYYGTASNTNKIVSARSVDIDYAVAELESLLGTIPKLDSASSGKLLGTIGLSLGGAVATEFAKGSGNEVRYVVNMDGGIYGELQDQPVENHYLMLYSEENSGINDVALGMANGTEIIKGVIPDTKHLNFHDISAIYPALKWLGAIGSVSPAAVIERRNELVHNLLSDH